MTKFESKKNKFNLKKKSKSENTEDFFILRPIEIQYFSNTANIILRGVNCVVSTSPSVAPLVPHGTFSLVEVFAEVAAPQLFSGVLAGLPEQREY